VVAVDGGWLTVAMAAGIMVGGALAVAVARHRGHIRVTVEVGDPPDRVTPPE
jgi:hypothetical protein